MNRSEPSGEAQKLQLVFMLAWSSSGSAWERFLSTLINGCISLHVITDSVTFLAIVKQQAMRNSKEHMLIAFMSFFDLIDACWLLCSAGIDYGTQTHMRCLLTFRHAVWFLTGSQTSTSMLAMVSIDRLVAASLPTWYWKATVAWTYKLVGIVVAWQGLFDIFLLYNAFSEPQGMVPYCFTSHVFGKGFDLDNNLRKFFLIASILIYIGVVVQYKRHLIAEQNKVTSTSVVDRNNWNVFKKRLRSMTKTLGISACITFCFYIVPLYLWGVLRKTFPSYQQYGWLCFTFVCLSSVANLFLFSYRHKEVKKAVVALFQWKQLSINMALW